MALGAWRKYSRGEAHGVEFFVMKQKTLFPAHFAPGRGANGFMKSTPGRILSYTIPLGYSYVLGDPTTPKLLPRHGSQGVQIRQRLQAPNTSTRQSLFHK